MQIKLQISALQCINPLKPYVQPVGIRTDDLFVPEMDAVPQSHATKALLMQFLHLTLTS
jgi:hypothetical protein